MKEETKQEMVTLTASSVIGAASSFATTKIMSHLEKQEEDDVNNNDLAHEDNVENGQSSVTAEVVVDNEETQEQVPEVVIHEDNVIIEPQPIVDPLEPENPVPDDNVVVIDPDIVDPDDIMEPLMYGGPEWFDPNDVDIEPEMYGGPVDDIMPYPDNDDPNLDILPPADDTICADITDL